MSSAVSHGEHAGRPHPPLTGIPDSIRLLNLHPGHPTQTISCTTYSVILSDDLKYSALSYTWGPVRPSHKILLNGHHFTIRESLWKFLMKLRSEEKPIILWSDQLCIDQENDQEKSQQVQNMGMVYEKADVVWIWLGDLEQSMERTMLFLSGITKLYEEQVVEAEVLTVSPVFESFRSEGTFFGTQSTVSAGEIECWLDSKQVTERSRKSLAVRMCESRPAVHLALVGQTQILYEDLYKGRQAKPLCVHDLIQELGGREYWQRAWVVQEVTLSKRCRLFAGSSSIPFWLFQCLVMNHFLPYASNGWANHIAVLAWPVYTQSGDEDASRPLYSPVCAVSDIRQLLNTKVWPKPESNRLPISMALQLMSLKYNRSREGPNHGWTPLLGLSKIYSASLCANWRDNIYSLLALTAEHRAGTKFRIDYSCTPTQMFFDTMQYAWQSKDFFQRADDMADALHIDLEDLINVEVLSKDLRQASITSNEGIAAYSRSHKRAVMEVTYEKMSPLVTLTFYSQFQFHFYQRKMVILPFMHRPGLRVLPGHCLFLISEDDACIAILESDADNAAIIGWAISIKIEHDLPGFLRGVSYSEGLPGLSSFVPHFDVLIELRIHGSHGHTSQYQKPHLCLNERQVLALLSTEEVMKEQINKVLKGRRLTSNELMEKNFPTR